jgi:hypothetical protein
MGGDHTDWAVQFHVPKDAPFAGKGPWACYLVVRADAKKKGGAAFNYGLYSNAKGAIAMDGADLAFAGDGVYHPYGIIVDELRPGSYFWVSPAGNGAGVNAIYVDRLFIQKLPGDDAK